jgi:hypothetical protein
MGIGKVSEKINSPTYRKWGEFIVAGRIDIRRNFFGVGWFLEVCISKTIFPHPPLFLFSGRITVFVKIWENGGMNAQNTKAEGGKRESGNEGGGGGGGKIQNPEAKIQGDGRNKAKGTSKEPEREQEDEVGLVELVPPMAVDGSTPNSSGSPDREQLAGGQASGLKDGSVRGRGRGGLPDTLDRTELVAVLEECGVSVKGFDGLRSDSYEKHLAGRSLVELEAFYRRLVYPSIGYGKIRKQCLPWGSESQYHGKLPTVKTLIDIKERILLEQAVRARMKAKKLMGALGSGRAESKAQELAMEYFKVAMEILAEELLVAKLEGKPVMENLKVVDRLVRVAGLRLRERKDNREQTRFEWEAEDRQTEVEEKAEAVRIANLPEPEYDPEALIERAFGPNPFKKKTDSEDNDEEDWELEEADEQSPDRETSNAEQNINSHRGTEDTENKAEGGKRESEGKIQNPEAKIQGDGRNKAESTNKESEVRSQEPEGGKMGLVELVPPGEKEENSSREGLAAVHAPGLKNESVRGRGRERGRGGFPDTLEDILIEGPSEKHPQGVRKCPKTGCAEDVLTGEQVYDFDWSRFATITAGTKFGHATGLN